MVSEDSTSRVMVFPKNHNSPRRKLTSKGLNEDLHRKTRDECTRTKLTSFERYCEIKKCHEFSEEGTLFHISTSTQLGSFGFMPFLVFRSLLL